MVKRSCAVIMIILILLCGLYVAAVQDRKLEEELRKEQEQTQLQEQPVVEIEELLVEETVPEQTEVESESEPEEELIYCEQVIDFVELQEENEDVYAWIEVPGTVIDYPILQSEKDNYYLNRNMDYSEGYPGSIYTNKCNAKDFTDANTILYGHNMKNGTMFAGLHKFKDANFFEEHDQILIYTKEARYTYQIYMAAAYGDAYIPAVYDVASGEELLQFCDSLTDYQDERKRIREDMEMTEEDQLLTLSTCIANEGTKRYLVIGKLVETALYYE